MRRYLGGPPISDTTPTPQTTEHGGHEGWRATHEGGVRVPHHRRLGSAPEDPTAWVWHPIKPLSERDICALCRSTNRVAAPVISPIVRLVASSCRVGRLNVVLLLSCAFRRSHVSLMARRLLLAFSDATTARPFGGREIRRSAAMTFTANPAGFADQDQVATPHHGAVRHFSHGVASRYRWPPPA